VGKGNEKESWKLQAPSPPTSVEVPSVSTVKIVHTKQIETSKTLCSIQCMKVNLFSDRDQQIYTSAIQFYLLHQHVSVTIVTIIRVLYSRNTSNTLVIT
jgi:hypothetical protein